MDTHLQWNPYFIEAMNEDPQLARRASRQNKILTQPETRALTKRMKHDVVYPLPYARTWASQYMLEVSSRGASRRAMRNPFRVLRLLGRISFYRYEAEWDTLIVQPKRTEDSVCFSLKYGWFDLSDERYVISI